MHSEYWTKINVRTSLMRRAVNMHLPQILYKINTLYFIKNSANEEKVWFNILPDRNGGGFKQAIN